MALAVVMGTFALATGSSHADIIGFEAESGTLGDDFDPAQADAGALGGFYITTETNSTGTEPGSDARTVSYSLTVPAGTYDVYVRARVGPGNPNDDSFFYANAFGNADPTASGDWVTVNGANAQGVPIGSFGWSNALTTTVTSAGGTVQWKIGGREDGFDIDALALVTAGQSVTDTELDNAVVPEEPSSENPKLTSITSAGGNTWELTLEGDASTTYVFRESATLDFTAGMLVENLTPGDPAVGTIGGTNDSEITTDGSGNATVQMTLLGPANFVRAEKSP